MKLTTPTENDQPALLPHPNDSAKQPKYTSL